MTGFKPFAGRRRNGSETLARHFAEQSVALDVRTHVLDVVWDAPAMEVLPLIATTQPDLVVGLGEGSGTCISLETVAVNLREGVDNHGDRRECTPIATGGPDRRNARFVFHYPVDRDLFLPILLSRSAGHFLCNEHLYVCAGTSVPKVMFIHVPPQDDMTDEQYLGDLAPTILALIEENLQPRFPGQPQTIDK